MKLKTKSTGITLIIVLLVSSVVANEKVAEYRHKSMEAVDVHFEAIKDILSGDVPFEDHLSKHVDALVDYADMMPDMFVEGSEGGEALDRIWEESEKERFEEALISFKDSMATLKDAVDGDEDDKDAISKAFRGVVDSCRSCHRRYRE